MKKFPITKNAIDSLKGGLSISFIIMFLGHFFGNPNGSKLLWQIPTGILSLLLVLKLYQKHVRVHIYDYLRRKNLLRFLKTRKKEMCTDETKLYRKMKFAELRAILYIGMIIISAFCILFFRAASGIGISMLLGVYVLCSISYILIYLLVPEEDNGEDDEEQDETRNHEPENFISRQDYPLLYELAEDVKKKLKLKKKLELYVENEGSVSVSESITAIQIFLDVVYVSILTKAELQHILMHEFTHVANGDTKDALIFDFMEMLTSVVDEDKWKKGAMFLFSDSLYRVKESRLRYREIVSRAHEILADQKPLEIGDAQTAANALGKLGMYRMYSENPYMYLNPDLSRIENASNHPKQERIADFKRELAKNEAEWRRILQLEIPRKIESHPITRERIKACHVPDYDVHTEELDEAYKKEIQKLVIWEEEVYQEDDESEKKEMREQYEERMKVIDRFQKKVNSQKENPYETFTVGQLYEVAEAFQVTDDDKAIELLDVILEKYPRHTLALGLKGQILLRLGKEEGLTCLFEIAKNHEREAEYEYVECIENYAYRYGRQDVLERCKEAFANMEETIFGWEDSVRSVTKEDVLCSGNLQEEQRKRIQNLAETCVFGDIEEVLYVQKKANEEEINLYFVVCKNDNGFAARGFVCSAIRCEMVKEMNNVIVQDIKKSDKVYRVLKEQVPDCYIYRKEETAKEEK